MNIRVDLNYTIKDGSEIVFRSPVDCSAITGLVVYYVAEDGSAASREFVLTDAHGHDVGDIDHLFSENVVVKVILDVTAGKAYVLNADTNAYIESSFIKKTNGTAEFFTVTELGVQDHTGDCKFTAYWEEEITDENGMPTGQVFSFYGAECDESVVLRGIHDPIMNHDAATKRYVDRKVAEVGNGSGQNPALTANERSALIAVINAIGVFNVPNGKELVDAFNAAWSGDGEPETPESGVTDNGRTLVITGGVTVTEDGDTLRFA